MREGARPTIRDIATRAGVSPTTVSHALNNVSSARVAKSTRERVLDAARDMGYQPNGLARGLRTQRSNMLALITDEVTTTPYAGKIVLGAQEAAARNGWLLTIVSTGGVTAVEERGVAMIWQHQVDGVLYAAAHHRILDIPRSLDGKPVILVNAESTEEKYTCIYPDEFQGGYVATQTLIRSGHSAIGFVGPKEPELAAQGRLAGYRAALKEAGIRYRPGLVVKSRGSFAVDGHDATSDLLTRHQPTGLFCFNDRMAMGAYRAAREAGLSVPNELSVVGFDNQEIIAEAIVPGLTTLALPYYEMGALAVDQMVAKLKGETGSNRRQIALPSTLISRGSVAGR